MKTVRVNTIAVSPQLDSKLVLYVMAMIREKRKRKRKSFLLLLVVLSFKRITYQKVTVHLIDETFGKKIQIEYLMMWSFNQQKSSRTVKNSFHFISFYSIIKEIPTIEYDKHFSSSYSSIAKVFCYVFIFSFVFFNVFSFALLMYY
jgi:hypothetical protein